MSSEDESSKIELDHIDLGPAAEATVHAYQELANDSSKRLALASDSTCINFLAYVIAEGAGSLVQGAIDTIDLIAQNPECRNSLANTFGVLEALQEMADDARYSEELRNQAAGIFTCLQFSRHLKKPSTDKISSQDSVDNGNKNGSEDKRDVGIQAQRSVDSCSSSISEYKPNFSPKTPAKNFLGSNNSKAKIITLYIKNMENQSHRMAIEEKLIKIRGLISIVFDLNKSRVTCRVKKDITVDKLASVITHSEPFDVQQVLIGANGEESIVNIMKSSNEISSPVEDLPDYLPEEESPVRDGTYAMAPSGSLRETATNLLTAAANLLQKSFYW